MYTAVHALIVLAVGCFVAAAFVVAGNGVIFLTTAYGVGAVAIIVIPLVVLGAAAFIGRDKKAGKGALVIGWLFVAVDVPALWLLWITPQSANDPIGVLVLVLAQTFVASAVLVLAFVQSPMRGRDAPSAT